MIDLEDIEATETTSEELCKQGYSLMSYDGELCLPENQRTRGNTNGDGGLTLSGARAFAKNILANLCGVKDVKIVHADSAYDVYALTEKN